MEKKCFSVKKIIAIVALTLFAVGTTAASATALSTKPTNVIPVINQICSTVADKTSDSQPWVSAYSQCISAQQTQFNR